MDTTTTVAQSLACVWIDEDGETVDDWTDESGETVSAEDTEGSMNGKEWVEEQIAKAEESNGNARLGVWQAHSNDGTGEANYAYSYLEHLRGFLADHNLEVLGRNEWTNGECDLLQEAIKSLDQACDALETAQEFLEKTKDLISDVKCVLRNKGFNV